MTLTRGAVGRLLISGLVVAILTVQAVAGFLDTGRWGWPLLAYPMYKTAHFDGERLNHDVNVHAILADSTRREIRRSDLGMDFWIFWYNVVAPINKGHLHILKPVIDRYCQLHDSQVVSLQVEDKGIAIGRNGPIEGLPPQIMFATDVSC